MRGMNKIFPSISTPRQISLSTYGICQGGFLPVHRFSSKAGYELTSRLGGICGKRSFLSLHVIPPPSPLLLQGISTIPTPPFPPLTFDPLCLFLFLISFIDRAFHPPTSKLAVASKARRWESNSSTDELIFSTFKVKALTLAHAVETPSSSTRGNIVYKMNMTI